MGLLEWREFHRFGVYLRNTAVAKDTVKTILIQQLIRGHLPRKLGSITIPKWHINSLAIHTGIAGRLYVTDYQIQ